MTMHDDLFNRCVRLLSYHRRRIWWITSRVVALTVVFSAFGLALGPKYVARTQLTLLPTRSELGFASVRPEVLGLSPATMLQKTQAETLMSRTLAETVAASLQNEAAPEAGAGGFLAAVRKHVLGAAMGAYHRTVILLNTGRWETPDPLQALTHVIRAATQVEALPGSFVFQVAVTWDDPETAARVANLITARYVEITRDASREEMTTTREYIEERIEEVEEGLAGVQDRIKDYRYSQKIYSTAYNTSADVDLGLQELSQSLRSLNAARVDWQELDSRIRALRPYQTPVAMAEVEAMRSGLKARQEALETVVNEQIGRLDQLPAKEAGLLDLYRERLLYERALTSLQDRLLETRVAEAAQLSAARVIDPAVPPLYPERPLLLRNAAASLVVGLLLSVGFVLLAEARYAGLRSGDDIDARHELLGIVPYIDTDADADPDAIDTGMMAELLRGLAHGRKGTVAYQRAAKRHLEHLFVRLAQQGPRVTLLAGLNGGEGKTFLIENLAGLAREAERKVLLIDGNFGTPALQARFSKASRPGLAEVLTGSAEATECIVSIDDHIDLLGAGSVPLKSHSRWDPAGCREQLSSLASAYDMVLMDSAALTRDPAASRLASLADSVVCVFDATRSKRDDLARANELLGERAAAMQLVLNKVLHTADFIFSPRAKSEQALPHGSDF